MKDELKKLLMASGLKTRTALASRLGITLGGIGRWSVIPQYARAYLELLIQYNGADK